jgi:hypothetical protein
VLAYDHDIRDAYFDGTLFVELGQQGRGRIVAAIADIIGLIDSERRRDFATIDGAKTALGEALGNRRFLLVIDDVWNRGDLMPFPHGGSSTTRLITTRFAGELPADVVQERVAAMTGGADVRRGGCLPPTCRKSRWVPTSRRWWRWLSGGTTGRKRSASPTVFCARARGCRDTRGGAGLDRRSVRWLRHLRLPTPYWTPAAAPHSIPTA